MDKLPDYDDVTVEIDNEEVEGIVDVEGYIIDDDDVDIVEVDIPDDFEILEVEAEEIESHEECSGVFEKSVEKIAGNATSIISDVVDVVNEVKNGRADAEGSKTSTADKKLCEQTESDTSLKLLSDIQENLLDEFSVGNKQKPPKGFTELFLLFWQASNINKVIFLLFVIFVVLFIIYMSNIIY